MCAPRSVTQNYATCGDAAPHICTNQLFYKDCRDIDPRSRRLVVSVQLRDLGVTRTGCGFLATVLGRGDMQVHIITRYVL